MSAHYFVADAHLGAGAAESEQTLLCFLESIRGKADSLHVLGDLFDFWFEYHRAIPKHGVMVLAELSRLRHSGTRVVYLAGNHDFRVGELLRREVEVAPGRDLEQTIDGLRVWMSHGDWLDERPESVLFRGLGRTRAATWLYSLLHPDIGVGLAAWVAGRSRDREPNEALKAKMAEFAEQQLGKGYDLVVLAHSHLPDLRRFGTGTYLNAGSWLQYSAYGVIRHGTVALERFAGQ